MAQKHGHIRLSTAMSNMFQPTLCAKNGNGTNPGSLLACHYKRCLGSPSLTANAQPGSETVHTRRRTHGRRKTVMAPSTLPIVPPPAVKLRGGWSLQHDTWAVAKDLTCGITAGVASVVVGQPLDTVKVRLQSFPGRYTSTASCLRSMAINEGVRACLDRSCRGGRLALPTTLLTSAWLCPHLQPASLFKGMLSPVVRMPLNPRMAPYANSRGSLDCCPRCPGCCYPHARPRVRCVWFHEAPVGGGEPVEC